MNILYLVNYFIFAHKMSRVRFHAIEEIAKVKNVKVVYSGVKWPNYNVKISVQQNIELIEAQENLIFDLVICYEPLHKFIKFEKIQRSKCIRYNEMYNLDIIDKEIAQIKPDIVICHYKPDVDKFTKNYKNILPTKFYHIPHCAKASIFKKNKNIIRDIYFLECGTIFRKETYPLRHRLATIIIPLLIDKGYNCEIIKHPLYKIKNAHKDKEPRQFANRINRAKICLSCSSIYKYRLAKFVEISMCGSVLCTDLPDQDQDEINEFIINIDMSMSDDEIIDILEKNIKDENRLNELRKKSLEFAKKYTQEEYAKRFVDIIKQHFDK